MTKTSLPVPAGPPVRPPAMPVGPIPPRPATPKVAIRPPGLRPEP